MFAINEKCKTAALDHVALRFSVSEKSIRCFAKSKIWAQPFHLFPNDNFRWTPESCCSSGKILIPEKKADLFALEISSLHHCQTFGWNLVIISWRIFIFLLKLWCDFEITVNNTYEANQVCLFFSSVPFWCLLQCWRKFHGFSASLKY